MHSQITKGGYVPFPENTGESIYMLPFKINDGLPKQFQRWQPTVDAMLAGIKTNKDVYLMVDQRPVVVGKSHRRGGPHVDGN